MKEVALLISEGGPQSEKDYQNREGHYKMIKRISPLRRYNNLKCMCTNKQSCKICEAKINKSNRRNI